MNWADCQSASRLFVTGVRISRVSQRTDASSARRCVALAGSWSSSEIWVRGNIEVAGACSIGLAGSYM